MAECRLCGSTREAGAKVLRDGTFICPACAAGRVPRIEQLQAEIQMERQRIKDLEAEYARVEQRMKSELRRPWTIGLALMYLAGAIVFILFMRSRFLVSISVAVPVIAFHRLASRKLAKANSILGGIRKTHELEKKPLQDHLSVLAAELIPIRADLERAYAQFWELPPDWLGRRQVVIRRDRRRCRSCHRKMDGSVAPFHVHHVIPKSRAAGTHDVENLELLCEICHSKMKAPGHDRIKEQRKCSLDYQRIHGLQPKRARRLRRWHGYYT